MLLFRSEGHIEAWRRERSLDFGAVMTLEQQWELAKRWYSDRLDPDWRRRSPANAQQVFADCGLTGPFWNLA
ncbi:MAG: hypothetical protein ACRDKF_06055 [Actinomycetota bacterium]